MLDWPGGATHRGWGTRDGERFEVERRAKLMLDAVPDHVLAAAAGRGVLVGRLGLTDSDGGPRCAAVRPPVVTWSAG